MTKNKVQKNAVRKIQALTGTAYSEAKRQLSQKETHQLLSELTVWELTDDGGVWFVEGTTDEDLARLAVRIWIIDTIGLWTRDPLARTTLEDHFLDLNSSKALIRKDWFFKGATVENPDVEEAPLQYAEKYEHHTEPLYEGVLFS